MLRFMNAPQNFRYSIQERNYNVDHERKKIFLRL